MKTEKFNRKSCWGVKVVCHCVLAVVAGLHLMDFTLGCFEAQEHHQFHAPEMGKVEAWENVEDQQIAPRIEMPKKKVAKLLSLGLFMILGEFMAYGTIFGADLLMSQVTSETSGKKGDEN